MPDNFFEMMSNFTSNHTAPNGTTSRKLKDEERRLASAYCSNAFSDMAGAYVLLGDTETAALTAFAGTSAAGVTIMATDPYINFADYSTTSTSHLEFYLVHNNPTSTGTVGANELCAEMKYSLDALNINPDKTDIAIGTTGATCQGCFAYGGAQAVVGMHCYKDEDDATVCDVSASLAGSFEYNVDVLLKDPSITATSTAEPIWNGAKIEIARFGDSAGLLTLVLDVTPKLHATVGGTLQATGELSAKAHAKGELEIGGKISDGAFTAFQTSSLTFDPLTFTATGFDVSGEEAEIVVTPDFSIGMSVVTSATTSALLSMTTSLQTPVSIATSSADCDTNYKVQSSATLTALGSPILGYSADLSGFPDNSVVISDTTTENMCLTYPDGKSGTTDSTPTSVEVSLSLSLSGITCEEYGTAEEAAVNVALAALIGGADAETFTDHECATGVTVVVDASRRALLSNAVTISTSVTVATDTYASASASDIATSVNSALDAAVTSGAFTTSVVSAGEAGGLTTLESVSVTSSTATAADTSIASRTAVSSFFAAVSSIVVSATVAAMF